MKKTLFSYWEKGYFYIGIGIIIYLIYCLNDRLGIYDWQKELAYFQYIKDSLTIYKTLPFFWWNKYPTGFIAIYHTSNFISNPETMLFSPFTPLLYFLSEIQYIKTLVFIHLLIGLGGLFFLKKQLQWNNFQFRTYSILFLFSPIIIQHLAVGYTQWLNLFFFPWIIFFLAFKNKILSILGLSSILSIILLEGGVHIFIWFAGFCALYFLSVLCIERQWKYLLHVLFLFALVFLLSFIRLFATAQSFSDLHQTFETAYNPLNFFLWSLIPPLFPLYEIFFVRLILYKVPSWDAGIFWGTAIPLLIVLFLKYKDYRKSNGDKGLNYDSVLIASSILFIFSFHPLLKKLIDIINSMFNLPFIDGAERYPYRLAIPAFFGFSIVISKYSQNIWQDIHRFFSRNKIAVRVLLIIIDFLRSLLPIIFIGGLFLLATITFTARSIYYRWKWLAVFTEDSSTKSKLQISIVLILFFSLFIFLVLQNKEKITKHFKHDLLLALPLLFSSLMWLMIAISTPATSFSRQNIKPPRIIVQSGFPKPLMSVTPQKLILKPQYPFPEKYVFPDIFYSDAKFLSVTSNNAILSNSKGKLSLISPSKKDIILEFKSKSIVNALVFTLFSWLLIIIIIIRYENIACKSKMQR